MFESLSFLEKEMFFFGKFFESFQNYLTRILFFRRFFKNYYCLCNLQMFKIWYFGKNWLFFAKKISKDIRSTIRIFYRECVSHFHVAPEFSKQSIFWVFGQTDVVFVKILIFFQNQSVNCKLSNFWERSKELKTFNSLRFPRK